MNFTERENLPRKVRAEIEKAYRRGYAQAAYCAARDVGEGADLDAWVIRCEQWRYALGPTPQKWAAIGRCPPEPWEVTK